MAALVTTTLSAALGKSDNSALVASATSITAGDFLLIDQEFVRVGKSYVSGTTIPLSGRGLNGTAAAAHVSGANVTHGAGGDFAGVGPQVAVSYPVAGRARTLTSYSAAGAIALPTPGTDAFAIINGASALAMTVADPTKDMDGDALYIASNGTPNHTVTFASGLSNAGSSYDVITFNGTKAVVLGPIFAVNGYWQLAVAVPLAGTVSNVTGTIG